MSYVVENENRVCSIVDEMRVKRFLKKYPLVEKSMLKYVNSKYLVFDSYVEWLGVRGETNFGGEPKYVESPSFGNKTFYKFDWDGISGWAEVFEYLTNRENGRV